MPNRKVKIRIQISQNEGTEVEVSLGTNVREALLEAGITPYRGKHTLFNCHGFGICGTCWVFVKEGEEFVQKRSCQLKSFSNLELRMQPNLD